MAVPPAEEVSVAMSAGGSILKLLCGLEPAQSRVDGIRALQSSRAELVNDCKPVPMGVGGGGRRGEGEGGGRGEGEGGRRGEGKEGGRGRRGEGEERERIKELITTCPTRWMFQITNMLPW